MKERNKLLILLGGLAVLRFALIFKGQLYWPDEYRYLVSVSVFQEFLRGDVIKGLYWIFAAANTRPVFFILSAIPAGVQHFFLDSVITSLNDPLLWAIPSFFNLAATEGIVLFFYLILRKVARRPGTALLGTLVYGLLANTNLYIRHLLPYDYSLLILMGTLWFLIKTPRISHLKNFAAGIMAALAFMTYPAYYGFVVVVAAVATFKSRKKIRAVLLFLAGILLAFALMEGLAQCAGVSFFRRGIYYSLAGSDAPGHRPLQGSFQENYIFLFRYLLACEGVIGYVLCFLLLWYVFLVLTRKSTSFELKVMFFTLISVYLLSATVGFIIKMPMFYGRILHMYYPLLVMMGALGWENIPFKRLRAVSLYIILAASVSSLIIFYLQYSKLQYPNDLKWKYLRDVPQSLICPLGANETGSEKDINRYPFITVNLNYIHPLPEKDYHPILPQNAKLLISASHPLNFTPYPFEGYTVRERRRIKERNYRMEIYGRY